jgi:hypothetical protein
VVTPGTVFGGTVVEGSDKAVVVVWPGSVVGGVVVGVVVSGIVVDEFGKVVDVVLVDVVGGGGHFDVKRKVPPTLALVQVIAPFDGFTCFLAFTPLTTTPIFPHGTGTRTVDPFIEMRSTCEWFGSRKTVTVMSTQPLLSIVRCLMATPAM